MWAATAASYCPSRAGEIPKQNMTKSHERWDGKLCKIILRVIIKRLFFFRFFNVPSQHSYSSGSIQHKSLSIFSPPNTTRPLVFSSMPLTLSKFRSLIILPRSGEAWSELYKTRSYRKIDSKLLSRELDFQKTFSLTDDQFSRKTYFIHFVPAHRLRKNPCTDSSPAAGTRPGLFQCKLGSRGRRKPERC